MYKKRSFCFWKKLKNPKGFTTTEIVVALSILGIMMAISIPSYFSWLPRHRLQTSTRQIYDDLNLAKIRAVKDNRNACVEFYPATETYTVFFDVDGIAGYLNGTDIPIKSSVTLENGIDITAANTCGFNNRGLFTAGPGQISLTNATGLVMGVNVNTAGGISVF
jgi:prepilin-type N-terminal cleavage/methylation domain-containing protein